jgi:hypothetical protein
MARTINEIYDSIIAEKENQTVLDGLVPKPDDAQTFLDDLSSASKVAIWRLFFWTCAVAIWAHENIFDLHKEEVETIASEAVTGTLRWYRAKSLDFQNGDTLVWNNELLKFEYPDGSTGEKIVSNAAAIESGNQVRIKVAKDDGSGGLEPLSASEQTSFTTYINRIKFAGTNVAIVNNVADFLKIELVVYYDPLILDSNGVLISDGTTTPVLDAVNSYIQNLPFNGVFNRTAFVDALQAAQGVTDPVLTTSEAKPSGGIYADTGDNYTADAGYLQYDDVNSIITYTPSNV